MSRKTLKIRHSPVGRVVRAKRVQDQKAKVTDVIEGHLPTKETDESPRSEDTSEFGGKSSGNHYTEEPGDKPVHLLTHQRERELSTGMLDGAIQQAMRCLDRAEEILQQKWATAKQSEWATALLQDFNPDGLRNTDELHFHLIRLFYGRGGHEAFEHFIQQDAFARACRDEYIKMNLGLVDMVARRYHHPSLTFLDFVQEGSIGLMKAVVRFDYRQGCRFSTYAVDWIRQTISRAIADKGREIRVPVYTLEAKIVLDRVTKSLTSKLARPPSDQEASKEMGISLAALRRIKERFPGVVSLDKPARVHDEASDDLHERLVIALDGPDPCETIDSDRLRTFVRNVIASDLLNARERDVIKRHYGMARHTKEEEEEESFRQIGAARGCTHQAVQQTHTKAMRKLEEALKPTFDAAA